MPYIFKPISPLQKGGSSIGVYSQKLHDFKHTDIPSQSDYEENVLRWIDQQAFRGSNSLLPGDLDYHDPEKRRELSLKYKAKERAIKQATVNKKIVGYKTPEERQAERLRHVQTGIPRPRAPWVPPYMRTPATAPNSPGKFGLIGNTPKELERCGGGYVERNIRTPTVNRHSDFKFGPLLKTVPPRTAPINPPRVQRALWVRGLPRNAGFNTETCYDPPRDKLHLISCEAEALFERPSDIPPLPDGNKCKIVPADAPHIQSPIFRPTVSRDFYRMYQFVGQEHVCM